MTFDDLTSLLNQFSYRFGNEMQMQHDVEQVLITSGVPFDREAALGVDRIDFLVGDIGIECKVGGSPSAVLEQLVRYADHKAVSGLILLTSRHTHRFAATEINGKRFEALWVAGRGF